MREVGSISRCKVSGYILLAHHLYTHTIEHLNHRYFQVCKRPIFSNLIGSLAQPPKTITMKLTIIAIFFTAAMAFPNADPNPEAEPLTFEKRQCDYTTGCRSQNGVKAGKYCGYCPQVGGTWDPTHVYQLNGQTGSAGCCDYGFRQSCKNSYDGKSSKYECGF